MRFNGVKQALDFIGNSMSRATVASADDSQLAQELSINGFAGEIMSKVEHWQAYGHTFKPSTTGEGQAESIMGFVGGNRSHPVVINTMDRRHRLVNLEDGEVGQYSDQKHQRVMHKDGVYDSAMNDKLHQERVQQDGDTPGEGASLPGFGSGQKPWKTKKPHSYAHHDAKMQQRQHPKKLNHHIIQSPPAEPPAGSGGQDASAGDQGNADIASQISGMASQLQGMTGQLAGGVGGVGGGLPGMNDIGARIAAAAAAITPVGDASGTIIDVTAEATTIQSAGSTVAGDLSGSSVTAAAAQIQQLATQMQGKLQGMMSQILHRHEQDNQKGSQEKVFNDQHSTVWDQQGVTHTSAGAKVTSTAQQIPHNGNTNVNPNLTVANNISAHSSSIPSDVRLKSNIEHLPSLFDKVMRLRAKTFYKRGLHQNHHTGEFHITPGPGEQSFGYIAQEVFEILPELTLSHHSHDYLGVQEGKTGIIAIHVLQEMHERDVAEKADLRRLIKKLEARVTALENRKWPTSDLSSSQRQM